jgi:hypothetical protein
MLPVDISEIHGALSLAYKVYDIGWNRVHDARKYLLTTTSMSLLGPMRI